MTGTVVFSMGLMVSLTAMSAFFGSSLRVKMGVVAQCPVVGAAISEKCEGVIVVRVVRV